MTNETNHNFIPIDIAIEEASLRLEMPYEEATLKDFSISDFEFLDGISEALTRNGQLIAEEERDAQQRKQMKRNLVENFRQEYLPSLNPDYLKQLADKFNEKFPIWRERKINNLINSKSEYNQKQLQIVTNVSHGDFLEVCEWNREELNLCLEDLDPKALHRRVIEKRLADNMLFKAVVLLSIQQMI